MGDMADAFNAMAEAAKKRKANNRKQSPKLLKQAGITFRSENDGVHLIVKNKKCTVDFWPGTGTWIVRARKRGCGVSNLIKYMTNG